MYPFISIAERLLIDAKIIEAMTTAESLKENIKKRYELEYIENQKNGSALACLHVYNNFYFFMFIYIFIANKKNKYAII